MFRSKTAEATETSPLAKPQEKLIEKEEEEHIPSFLSKFGAPIALTFYITVAVVKTMLTKALFEGGAAYPVAFSAVSAIATCVCLLPVFAINRGQWAVPKREYGGGFLLVCVLVAMDLALTNIAVSLLAIAIQQCIIATNPAFTVTIESIVKRKLAHPAIYAVITVLCFGPIVAQSTATAKEINILGIVVQLLGVTCSACKYVFAHSIMQICKKDLGTFAFLFWIDLLILGILLPWAFINGEMILLMQSPETAMDWVNLIFTAILGGIRFFSQLLVLKVSTATTLSCANLAFQAINIYLSLALFGTPKLSAALLCGSLITLSSAGVYTYFKVSKVLEKSDWCIQKNDQFKACVGYNCACCLPKTVV